MRINPPRPTVRRLMALVVVLAAALSLGLAAYRRVHYRRQARACIDLAELQEEGARMTRGSIGTSPGRGAQLREMADRFDRRAAFFRRREILCRDAADHPWRTGPRPEPAPD